MSYHQNKRNLELHLFKLKAAEIKQRAAEIDRTLQATIQAANSSSGQVELSPSRDASEAVSVEAVKPGLIPESGSQASFSNAEMTGR